MGNKYEVYYWIKMTFVPSDSEYDYLKIYSGNSLLKAIWTIIKSKKLGIGCVKFEIRR